MNINPENNKLPRSHKRIFNARGTFGAYKSRLEQQVELVNTQAINLYLIKWRK
jgi:hypothetical protein